MTPQQAKDLEENPVWQAFKRGEEIEYFMSSQSWLTEGFLDVENLIIFPKRYRIKPQEFPTPPEGEEWHNPDKLTPGQIGVKDGWRLLLESEIGLPHNHLKNEGKYLDGKCLGWEAGEWSGMLNSGLSSSYTYRTREPLPQNPKMVPLKSQDIPPGSAIRKKSDAPEKLWDLVSGTESFGVSTRDQLIHFSVLQKDHWEILRPGSDKWERCEKPEKLN